MRDGEQIECFIRFGVSQTLPETVEEFRSYSQAEGRHELLTRTKRG